MRCPLCLSVTAQHVDFHRPSLKNGAGILACLDGYMNIAMEQTEEYVNGQLKNKYGDAFIRGNNGEHSLRQTGWRTCLTCCDSDHLLLHCSAVHQHSEELRQWHIQLFLRLQRCEVACNNFARTMNACSCCRLFDACYMCPVGWNRTELFVEHSGTSAINLSHMSHQTEAKHFHSSNIVLLPGPWVGASDHNQARCATALLFLHLAICSTHRVPSALLVLCKNCDSVFHKPDQHSACPATFCCLHGSRYSISLPFRWDTVLYQVTTAAMSPAWRHLDAKSSKPTTLASITHRYGCMRGHLTHLVAVGVPAIAHLWRAGVPDCNSTACLTAQHLAP